MRCLLSKYIFSVEYVNNTKLISALRRNVNHYTLQLTHLFVFFRATSRGVISVMTRMIADEDNRTVEHRSIEQTGGVAATPHVLPMATSSGHIDKKLACAAARALHDGCLTPIIKEELRLTIQSKRLKRGQNEMSVSFRQPAPEQVICD